MGFFSGQVMNESYGNAMVKDIKGYSDGYYSAKQAMVDNIMNEQTMFEGMILSDIQESVMRIQGANDNEIMAYTENVLTDILDKIKEFLMKVWEKIKAIFRGWMAKLDSVMMKNNKEFVNKYRKIVSGKDLTDMKVTWRKPKAELKKGIAYFDVSKSGSRLDLGVTSKNAQATLDKWDQDDELCKILTESVDIVKNLTDSKDFEKEFVDAYLDDEEEDDTVGNDINGIMAELLSFKDTKKNHKKANDSLNKAMSHLTKAIDKDVALMSKAMPIKDGGKMSGDFEFKKYTLTKDGDNNYTQGSDNTSYQYGKANETISSFGSDKPLYTGATAEKDKEHVENIRKGLLIVQKYANLYATAANKYTAAVMKVLKMWNDGNRKVWAAAVAYFRKEESVMTEAMMELAAYEAE